MRTDENDALLRYTINKKSPTSPSPPHTQRHRKTRIEAKTLQTQTTN